MASRSRSKKYELEWPLDAQQMEQIDEMFRDLFEDLANGSLFPGFAKGDILIATSADEIDGLADVATGNVVLSGGLLELPTYGKVTLTTHVDGVLPIANGGTNSTATPTDGGIVYGDGTRYQLTTVGTADQVLTSQAAGVPTWQNVTALGYWSPLTNGDPDAPEPIYDADGDMIAVWTET